EMADVRWRMYSPVHLPSPVSHLPCRFHLPPPVSHLPSPVSSGGLISQKRDKRQSTRHSPGAVSIVVPLLYRVNIAANSASAYRDRGYDERERNVGGGGGRCEPGDYAAQPGYCHCRLHNR